MNWQPISSAPEDVIHIAENADFPELGEHIGNTFTLSDGRWLVLKYHPFIALVESYIILPAPPK